MKKREQHLRTQLEWWSTWWEHFRHIYWFVWCLCDALSQWDLQHVVNYDTRKRFDISVNNFDYYQTQFTDMRRDLMYWEPNKEIQVALQSNSLVTTKSSIIRELHFVIEHAHSHLGYFENHWNIAYNTTHIIELIKKWSTLDHEDLFFWKLGTLFDQFEWVNKQRKLPSRLIVKYNNMIEINNMLSMHIWNDEILFDDMATSILNEYYKLFDQIIHLLYDVRLYLYQNNQSVYQQIISKNPNFGYAESTIKFKSIESQS